MTVNVDLLQRTMKHIEQRPEQWQQGTWAVERYQGGAACKTAFCFAGWAVQLAGHDIAFEGDIYRDERYAVFVRPGGETIMEVARRELGLTDEQAHRLFNGCNSLGALRSIVAEFVEEARCADALHDAVAEFVEEAQRTREKELVA